MAILDTFYLLFKSDTSDLKKGASEAQKIIGGLGKVLAAAIPTGLAIAALKNAISAGVELSQTSKLLGANAADLQAWSNAAELAGGSAAGFQNNLKSLAQRFNTSADVMLKVLPKYADILSKLSPSRAQQIGKNLGLDESTILLLQQGRREVENVIRRQKELSVVTKEDTENFLKYNRSLTETKQLSGALGTVIATEVVPYLNMFFQATSKAFGYFLEHKGLIKGAFIAVGGAAAILAAPFVTANAAVIAVTASIGLLIAAFAAVFEDFQKFKDGAQSVSGLIANRYNAIGKAISEKTDNIPAWLKILTGQGALSGGLNLSNLKDSLSSAKLNLPSLGVLSGKNSLAANSTVNNHVDSIVINTQSSDPQGIFDALGGELSKAFSQVSNFHGDGVFA